MRSPRTLVIGIFAAALLVATVAAPVAAAKTKLAIVNGIPGKRVDVCVNGREVKSGLRYGKFVFKTTRTAKATVKFYKPDPRRCGGKLLAKKTSGIDDATWVVTRRHPNKIVVFDNAFLATPIAADGARGVWRYAGDLGLVELQFDIDFPIRPAVSPAADTWSKGVGDATLDAVGFTDAIRVLSVTTWVRQGGVDIVRPIVDGVHPMRRVEWILLGTSPANTRFAIIDRAATLVS